MDVERAVEAEDDLFFADLTRRISLLITEDDEDFQAHYPPPLSLQNVWKRQDHHQTSQPFLTSHPLLCEASNGRETNKGTGVFIPRSSLPRRKHRSGRSKQQSDKARAASGRLTCSTTTTTNNP